MTDALEVTDLAVSYRVRRVWRPTLHGVSFAIPPGGAFGLVGESGCGKSTAATAIVRYLAANGRVDRGIVRVDGVDVQSLDAAGLRDLRARRVSMVYQNPLTALNPTMRIGAQMAEVFHVLGVRGDAAVEASRAALERVQVSDPVRVMQRYPHQLSGGMAQRVVIAMALTSEPALLILDEPTTGLDATVEAEVLDLIAGLRREVGTAVLYISHDLGVIRRMCDDIGVLYAGRLVERGRTAQVFSDPRHPYTVGLLRCIPRAGLTKEHGPLATIPGFLPDHVAGQGCAFADRCAIAQDLCRTTEPPLIDLGNGHASRCHFHDHAHEVPLPTSTISPRADLADRPVLLEVRGLSKTFVQDGHPVQVLRDIDLVVRRGETLGLVGESGSGKTTLAKAVLGIHAPDEPDAIWLDGTPLAGKVSDRDDEAVRRVQIVFQNPDSALNPSHSVRSIIGRALARLSKVRGAAAQARTVELTRSVQLADRYLDARPAQLSGGLKQRVAIARAFAGEPALVVCDEPTSALDVSVQAAIVNLLVDLQTTTDVAYLMISHNLGVVRFIADRLAVMYLGELMEQGDAAQVFDGPHHPYTEALLSAVSTVDGNPSRRVRLHGEVPSAAAVPSGCPFHTRCPRFIGSVCVTERPPVREPHPGHQVRCHLSVEQLGRADGSVALPVLRAQGADPAA